MSKLKGKARVKEIINELRSPHVSLDDVRLKGKQITKILMRVKCPDDFKVERTIKLSKANLTLMEYVWACDNPKTQLNHRNEKIREGAVRIFLSVADILYTNF